jgi:hypothetical protein
MACRRPFDYCQNDNDCHDEIKTRYALFCCERDLPVLSIMSMVKADSLGRSKCMERAARIARLPHS